MVDKYKNILKSYKSESSIVDLVLVINTFLQHGFTSCAKLVVSYSSDCTRFKTVPSLCDGKFFLILTYVIDMERIQ